MRTLYDHAACRDPRAGVALEALAFARHAVEAEDDGHQQAADERALHARVLLYQVVDMLDTEDTE